MQTTTAHVAPAPSVDVVLEPRRTARVLSGAVVVLTLLSLASMLVARAAPGAPGVNTAVRYLWVDREANVPTWFSSLGLALAALVAAGIAARVGRGDRWRRHWVVLAAAFAYLSLDELTEIHEQAIAPLQGLLGVGGLLFFAWVVLAVPLVAVFALAYLRFLADLPAATRRGLLLAGALYVGGAAGVEMLGGLLYSTAGPQSLAYVLVTTVEELLEMSGTVLAVVVLSGHRQRLDATV